LMELGALVCTPRSPSCGVCPLRRSCRVRAAGDPEALPIKQKKTRVKPARGVAAWIERKGKTLAVRRLEGGLLGGMWELPGGTIEAGENARAGLRRCLRETLDLDVGRLETVGPIEHLFSHRKLRLEVFRAHDPRGRVRRSGLAEHRWLAPRALAQLPQGGPTRKALALLGQGPEESPRKRIRERASRKAPLSP
ncbi:MAG: NUDIX domain-containing protein, partial [Myxococcota bacterium]